MKVLVVSVHGFHLGYIGCYGNEWVATPTLDALAAKGVVFDQHFADYPDVAEARRSWTTGCYSFAWPAWLPRSAEVPERKPGFLDKGIHTVLITEADISESEPGWDRIHKIDPGSAQAGVLEQTVDVTLRTLDRMAALTHWLVKVEIAALLSPSEIPEEFLDAYEDDAEEGIEEPQQTEIDASDDLEPEEPSLSPMQRSFAAAVTYFDAALDRLLAKLQKRSWAKELVLVITSDCGQAIDETRPGSTGQTRLHEELIHIPLIMHFPDERGAGRRIGALTQTVDLLPTLAALFEVPIPEVQGRNLLPLILGQEAKVRDYVCASFLSGATIEWALRSPNWSYLLPLQEASAQSRLLPELYVKPEDRWEVNNVIQHHPELAGRLENTLRDFVVATANAGPLVAPALQEEEEVEAPQSN